MLGFSPTVEVAVGVASVAMFVGTLIAIPIVLVRLPSDWFVRPRAARPLALRIIQNVIGVALVAIGIAMLVLPGQGILTMLVGLGILDLPGKDRVLARILSNAKVHGAIDKIRRKHGKGSLQVPATV